ncbi:hypothetical protein Cgig2_001948 [Carnegiea gigantea]|uniref:Uncharacterized protein n=1 Tax=Carnegiea gigantea TaxID=171969 RepID=A0A9Q1QBF6_9CARY|nr:hypothetical protein Cgig2_001948 [Carnegiea gigantea]
MWTTILGWHASRGFELVRRNKLPSTMSSQNYPGDLLCDASEGGRKAWVLQGQALRSLESALTELRWSAFKSWIWLFGDRIYEAQFRLKGNLGENSGAGRQEKSSGRGTVNEDSAPEEAASPWDDVKQQEGVKPMNARPPLSLVFSSISPRILECSPFQRSGRKHRESGQCPCFLGKHSIPPYLQYERYGQLREGNLHLALEERFAPAPPRPLPEDFHILYLCFSLAEAEGAAVEFELPEVVQAIFYAMLLNEAVELGVAHEYTAESMKSSLVVIGCHVASVGKSGDVLEGLAGPQVEGQHPQFSSLPAFIDGRVVASVSRKNKYRGPKKIPYAMPLFEPGNPSWSSYEYSSNPSILSYEVESNLEAEVASTSSSASSGTGLSGSSSRHSSRSSSSERASTSSSSSEASLGSGKLVLKRKGRTPVVTEIVAEGSEFPGVPTRSDPQDGPGSHFPNPKVIAKLKRSAHEKQYLLPAEYSFVILEADAAVNEPPAKCIAVYRAALNYGLYFPLHPVIREILNKYELVPAQVVPTSWHNICSFIATCDLRGLTCAARAFGLVHTVQESPKQTGDLGWYYFNNRPGFMTAIEKKSKVKHLKYDFLFLRRESGWGDVPDWNEGKPMRNPFREPTVNEQRTVRYFQFYIREDDKPRPIPKFIAQAIESVKGVEKRRSKSSDREPLNWLPKLKFFANDFFLATAGLLILKNYTKGT